MIRILMTGFEPFGGAKINPSWQAVLGVTAPEGVELIKRELPVRWRDTADTLNTCSVDKLKIERHWTTEWCVL